MTLPGPRLQNLGTPSAEKSKALVTWLQDNGMYLSEKATWGRPKHPLAIANETSEDGESSGRGLVAVKGIVQGESIFEVPFDVVLTKDRALEEVPGLPEDIDDYVAIAVLLMQERAKGEDSFWKPYLDILPKDDELIPLFRWSQQDMLLLEGSPCIPAALSLKAKLQSEFETVQEQVFEGRRDKFPEHVYTFEAWEWAFAVLFSRAINLTAIEKIALVPYADLLNHNPFCSTYIDVTKRQFSNERYVSLYTDRPYSQMDQAFVTYGPKSNGELLLLYGFITDRNPYDSVDIVVSLAEDDELFDRKEQYLKESGLGMTSTFPLFRDRYPKELVEFLRFCVADEEEFETADFGDFINESNETLVAKSLIQACKTALGKYPQTREDDDKLMKDRSMYRMLEQKQRWAIRQRRAEKRILERTIANLEQEMRAPTFMFTQTGDT